MAKAAAEASGDCVRLLEIKTRGIHGVASAADHPLERDEGEEEIHSDSSDPCDPLSIAVTGRQEPQGQTLTARLREH